MLVLGLETSCDETGLALVRDGELVAHKLSSQEEVHALFGGVVPELAGREHLRILPLLYDALMREADVSPQELDAVAVARGPGLLGSLLVGVSFAKGLAGALGIPLVGVNHLHAHLLVSGLEADLPLPALGVLVSGGHTNLYLVNSPWDIVQLGRTLDDAAGEAFDKAAKAMNFPYPGGRYVDALAKGVEPDRKLLPRPYLDNDNLDFSFSGLKTAVVNHLAANPGLRGETMEMPDGETMEPERARGVKRLCAALNWAVSDTLRVKAARAIKGLDGLRSVVVAGGVAANSAVREAMTRLARDNGLEIVLPGPTLCTDNGIMIAYAGWLLASRGLSHGLDLEAVPRGRTVPRDFLEK